MMKKLRFPKGMSLNIRSKFTISFLAMGLLPLFMFALISYNVYLKGLEKNVTTYSFEVIDRIDKNLETYISDIENILKLRSDYYVQQYLKLYDAGDIDGNRKYTMRLWETFDYLKKMKTDLEDIRLISHKGRVISCYGTYWEDIGSNALFEELMMKEPDEMAIQAPHLSMHNKRVFSIGKIVNDMDKQGIMCIDINVDILNTICNDIRLGEKGYVYLAQENGNVVFFPERADKGGAKNRSIKNHDLLKSFQGSFVDTVDGINYIVTYKTSAITSWKIIGVSPQSEMAGSINEVLEIFYWMIPTIIIFTVVLTIYLTTLLTNPIRELRNLMHSASENDLSIVAQIRTKDEIGQLAESFNIMIRRIKELMGKVVDNQKKIRKMEMKAMQEMIKPHFIYNTLDSIIGLLEQNRNNDAINMIDSLGKFFRTSLSHGREMVQIQEELDHIRSYLMIQQFRFSNKFDYIFEVDESVYRYKIIKLVLQPLVENSIYHGIRNIDKQGLILIKGYLEENMLIFEIIDNGKGMEPEKIEHINRILSGDEVVSDENLYFGIRNVNERIKLNFGGNSGLKYEIGMTIGTRVVISIPLVK
jgi:two-component system sensor histidine kinase YesM